MTTKVSRATLHARAALLELRAAHGALENQNAELGQAFVDQGVLLNNSREQNVEQDRAIKSLQAEVADQVERLNAMRKARDEAVIERDKAREVANRTTADNDNLRHELMRMEIDKARLEGHLERVREFDPITEQRQYRDGLRSVDEFERNGSGAMVHHGQDRVGWYLRRAG